jgi:hypothetical protein
MPVVPRESCTCVIKSLLTASLSPSCVIRSNANG